MGLDITAYELFKPVDNPTVEEIENGLVTQWHVASPIYKTLDGINTKYVRCMGNKWRFRAGSYSGYNAWRAWLCRSTLGVEPKTVWDNPGDYENRPFFKLINFSDCEGCIGPNSSASLAKDFAAHQFDGEDWERRLYRYWSFAFELAADNGFVEFH